MRRDTFLHATEIAPIPSHRVGGNRKHNQQSTNADQKSIETAFSIAICHPTSKIDRNGVFDCQFSPVGRQMAIENAVSFDFLSTFPDMISVFDCRLPGVTMRDLFS